MYHLIFEGVLDRIFSLYLNNKRDKDQIKIRTMIEMCIMKEKKNTV